MIARKFQFLVGTLKTFAYSFRNFSYVIVSIPRRYAKNKGLIDYKPSGKVFQFLVGTLKTDHRKTPGGTGGGFNSS